MLPSINDERPLVNFPPVEIVYFIDQTENGQFVILIVCNKELKQNLIQIVEFDTKCLKIILLTKT